MDCMQSRRHRDPRKAQLRKCTLHCMRYSCHRRSGGSSFRMIASMLKSGCRRCAAKGSRPRNESLPSRVQAGHTWWADGPSTTGSMHPRQKLHAKKALSISTVLCLQQVQARRAWHADAWTVTGLPLHVHDQGSLEPRYVFLWVELQQSNFGEH